MDTLDYIKNIIIILLLGFTLLFVLTLTHIVPCSSVSYAWCDIYWDIMGPPKILIAYGGDGLGNAEKLQEILADHDIVGVRTQLQNIEYIKTTSALKPFDMVIVTQAKTMTADQLQIFDEYSLGNNILIWTGDAGTSIPPGEKRPKDFNYNEESVWARVASDGKLIPFYTRISADYIDNYCNIVNCNTVNQDFVGSLAPEIYSEITSGIKPKSQLFGNVAIVTLVKNTTAKMDLGFDHMANLFSKGDKKTPIGQKVFPVFIRTGLGGNVFYSAVPLENLIDVPKEEYKAINTGMQFPNTIRNIYKFYFGKYFG